MSSKHPRLPPFNQSKEWISIHCKRREQNNATRCTFVKKTHFLLAACSNSARCIAILTLSLTSRHCDISWHGLEANGDKWLSSERLSSQKMWIFAFLVQETRVRWVNSSPAG